MSELLHGVHRARGARRTRRRAFVEHLLSQFEPVPITEPVTKTRDFGRVTGLRVLAARPS